MNKSIYILLFIFEGLITHAQNKIPSSRIDSLFTIWDKTNSPGCALGIIKDGQMIYSRGYGIANLELGEAIHDHTVFDIGSTSKQFTATAIILLHQQGKLHLDDDVRKYIPELPDYGKMITIRNLLNHTSGLRDYNELMFLAGYQLEQVTTKQNAIDIIIRQKNLNFPTGTDWEYTNTGFFLASVIVERVSRMSMKAFAEQHIFRPLGMRNTFYLDNHTMIVPYRATAYDHKEGGGFQINMSNWEQTGDGAVQTSISDMALWDQNFYNPIVGGQDLIHNLTTVGSLSNGEKLDYALGLFRENFMGLDLISHGGAWAGYRAEMIRVPSEHFSVICLSNLASFQPTELAKEVVKIYLAEKIKDSHLQQSKGTEATIDILSGVTGNYRTESSNIVLELKLDKGKLINSFSNQEWVYQGIDEFISGSGNKVKFIRDKNQNVNGFDLEGTKAIHFIRYTPVAYIKAEFADANGAYFSEELNAVFQLSAGPEGLILTAPNIAETFKLKPISRTIHYSQAGSIELTFNKNKKVEGFLLSFARVHKITFKKR